MEMDQEAYQGKIGAATTVLQLTALLLAWGNALIVVYLDIKLHSARTLKQ